MIALQNTTSTLEMQAGSDPGANVPVHVTFLEYLDSVQIGDRAARIEIQNPQIQHSQLASGGTTAVTVLSAPSSGRRRLVKTIFLRNAGAGSVQYKIRVTDTSATPNSVELRFTIATGEVIHYEDGVGWQHFDASGYSK